MTKETIDNIKEINSFEMDDKKYYSTVFMTSMLSPLSRHFFPKITN